MFCHFCGSNSEFIPNPPPPRSTRIPTFVLRPLQRIKETWYKSLFNRSGFGERHAKRTDNNWICRRCETPSSVMLGAELHGQCQHPVPHQSQARFAPGSSSAITSSEGRRFRGEDAVGRRLVIMNPDPPSSLSSSSSSSFDRSRGRSRNRAHTRIQQPADYLMTGALKGNKAPSPGSCSTRRFRPRSTSSRVRTSLTGSAGRASSTQNSPDGSRSSIVQPATVDQINSYLRNLVSESAPAPTRAQEWSAALPRSKRVFHARINPHPRDSTAREDTYSLSSIPEDSPMPASSSSPTPNSTPASSPQVQAQLQTHAPSTSCTNKPLPSIDTTRKRIVIHLSNHEPGPRIIPQKNGVFIRTKYAVEIASVQIGSSSCIDTDYRSSSSSGSATASSSRSSGTSRISSPSSPSSPSIESDNTATNEIAGLDISKVKPAYFYRVLRAGTLAIQGGPRREESDSALRGRRNSGVAQDRC